MDQSHSFFPFLDPYLVGSTQTPISHNFNLHPPIQTYVCVCVEALMV